MGARDVTGRALPGVAHGRGMFENRRLSTVEDRAAPNRADEDGGGIGGRRGSTWGRRQLGAFVGGRESASRSCAARAWVETTRERSFGRSLGGPSISAGARRRDYHLRPPEGKSLARTAEPSDARGARSPARRRLARGDAPRPSARVANPSVPRLARAFAGEPARARAVRTQPLPVLSWTVPEVRPGPRRTARSPTIASRDRRRSFCVSSARIGSGAADVSFRTNRLAPRTSLTVVIVTRASVITSQPLGHDPAREPPAPRYVPSLSPYPPLGDEITPPRPSGGRSTCPGSTAGSASGAPWGRCAAATTPGPGPRRSSSPRCLG